MKTSSKCVMTFILRMSGRKVLLIKTGNVAGSMEIPQKNPLNSHCWFPMKNCVKRCDCSLLAFGCLHCSCQLL